MKIESQIVQVVESSESDVYSEIIGIDLIVFSITGIGFNFIHSPLNFDDYDKYWRFLFKGHYESGYCGSETFEEFKQEVIDTEEMEPCITEETKSEFKVIRELSEEEFEKCLANYDRHFNRKED